MASLEELLAEEGFKVGKLKSRPRSSYRPEAVSMPLFLFPDHNPLASSQNVRARTERTRSSVSRHRSKIEVPGSQRVRSRRSKNVLLESDRFVIGSKKDFQERDIFEERDYNDMYESETFNVGSFENSHDNLGLRERFKETFWDKLQEKERLKDTRDDDSNRNISTKHMVENMDISGNPQRSLKESQTFYKRSSKSSQNNRKLNDLQSRGHVNAEEKVSEPALDEVAIRAVVSILTGYPGRFIKDKNFRTSLRLNCLSCLSFSRSKEQERADSGVVANLKQAMETVERAAEEYGNSNILKKASLQLSVIAGLNSKDLKDGFTSGIRNSHLAACAHLYLSVLYKLQKKDKLSAKHLLQVFCDSPFQARTTLLPELWDCFFLPHLSHLRVWYDQEAESIPDDTSSRLRKLKLLEKVYDEILDTGTYQFALYYKDWLTEGNEAPDIPSIYIPSISVRGISQGGLHGPSPELVSSPVSSLSSQPMISKRLYESVFGQSNIEGGADKVKGGGEDNFNFYLGSFDDTTEEDEGKGTYSPQAGAYTGQSMQEDDPCKSTPVDASLHADGLLLTPEEECGLHMVAAPEVKGLEDEVDTIPSWNTISWNTNMLHTLPHAKANELILKKLAESVFQLQMTEDSVDFSAATPSLHSKHLLMPDSYTNQNNDDSRTECELKKPELESTTSTNNPLMTSSCVELYGDYECFEDSPFFSSTPKDFICPLTGQLFEDPVTLETGQTLERAAIKKWFDQGHRTCPVTGRALESLTVPITNFVLRRVIDGWKSERCRNLFVFATEIAGSLSKQKYKSKNEGAIFVLEQLLTGFNTEERMENARHLISLGGLQFLIWRLELGNLEEKTRVVAILSCCIQADGCCRNYLATNIKKGSILELLHSKQVSSRRNVVTLLIELICLNRRTSITSFLNGLLGEGIMNAMHVLLVYLRTSPLEQRPLVAILLLHFDLLVEPRRYSIYREEAVDAITTALDCSLTDEKVRAQSCRGLLILAGHFSFSGEILTEAWLLKQAGFYDGCDANCLDNDDGLQIDETMPWEEEEMAREEWLKSLAVLLLGNGRKSFLDTITKCLGSREPDLVRACLNTVAWLSHALASIPDAGFQLSAFSALIPRLKESLENDERVECRVLASMSLHNFIRISECRVLLMAFAQEIMVSLRCLAGVTWTAKELCAIISSESL